MKSGEQEIGATLRETVSTLLSFSRWILALLFLLYLFSGVYSIAPSEVGLLQRFGKVMGGQIQPGIHYALPWPIDRVTKVPVKTVSRIMIDDFFSAARADSTARLFFNVTGLASYCISGDNNLVNIQCVIQYNITNPSSFLFKAKDPIIMLRSMACNAIIHCLAKLPVDQILTRGKQEIANNVKFALQKRLDELDAGLSISFIELSDIKPPDHVQRFFSDVVKAKIDRAKMVNEAQSYRNERIPAAQANASKSLQESEAYKREVVLRAEGDTERFLQILERAQRKGDSAREMIYVETMKEIMKNVEKKHILVPEKDGTPPARLRLNCR